MAKRGRGIDTYEDEDLRPTAPRRREKMGRGDDEEEPVRTRGERRRDTDDVEEAEFEDVSPEVLEQARRLVGPVMKEGEEIAKIRSQIGKLEIAAKRSEMAAKLLDTFGLDPILGLAMGAGDLLTGAAGIYIIAEAFRAGVPKWKILWMLTRLTVDVLVGSIPIVGDVMDFFMKPNKKNAATIREYLNKQRAEMLDKLTTPGRK